MGNLIAARIGCYQDHKEAGWAHLPTTGVRHVEIPVPAPDEMEGVRNKLKQHGLSASSLQARFDIQEPDVAESAAPAFDACAELGAKVCFVSLNAGDLPRQDVKDRLRAVGDKAAERNVVVCLETHRNLAHNGDVALETMKLVDHPNVRINFDTGNIYYYNRGRTATEELGKIIDYVGAVHIKDSTGAYEKMLFPVVGTGIVDFPEVFRMFAESGFTGPFTLELEGPEKRTREAQLKHVADSVAYLKQIGAFG